MLSSQMGEKEVEVVPIFLLLRADVLPARYKDDKGNRQAENAIAEEEASRAGCFWRVGAITLLVLLGFTVLGFGVFFVQRRQRLNR